MRISFAGPRFTAAERDWNAALAGALRAAGHEVFLPQEQEPDKDAAGIFATDVSGIDRAESLVAIMDGADPDSGTCREVGYAYRKKADRVVRTDRRTATSLQRDAQRIGHGPGRCRGASIDRVASELPDALARLEG